MNEEKKNENVEGAENGSSLRWLTQNEKVNLVSFAGSRWMDAYCKYDSAAIIKKCDLLLKDYSNDYDAWLGMGFGHIFSSSENGLDEALKCWEQSHELMPSDDRASRLYIYFLTRDVKERKSVISCLNNLKHSKPVFAEVAERWKQDLMKSHNQATIDFSHWCASSDFIANSVSRTMGAIFKSLSKAKQATFCLSKKVNIAILIAILALFVGMIPDDVKSALWKLAMERLQQE